MPDTLLVARCQSSKLTRAAHHRSGARRQNGGATTGLVAAALTEDCRQSAAADETGGTYTEGPHRAYGLHPAICVEDTEGQGEHVARHAVEAGGCAWHQPHLRRAGGHPSMVAEEVLA